MEGKPNKGQINLEKVETFEDKFLYGFENVSQTKPFIIRGSSFPEIVYLISKPRENRLPWLKRLLSMYGVNYEGDDQPLAEGLLYILSGCTQNGSGSDLEHLNANIEKVRKFRNKVENSDINNDIEASLKRRKKIFLEKRDLDKDIEKFLNIIEERTGIKPLEIFRDGSEPVYYNPKNLLFSSQKGRTFLPRDIKSILQDVVFILQGKSNAEIATLTKSTTTKVSSNINFYFDPTKSIFTEKMKEVLRESKRNP